MARPAGRTRSDVKPLVRDGWAPPSRTPGPTPPPAPWEPKPRESLRLTPHLGTPGLKRSGVLDVAPASSLRLLPSSRSRKQPGHIERLQIRRCPNKGCSGGGSFLLLIWRFRVAARCSLAPSRLPGYKPGAQTRAGVGDARARRAQARSAKRTAAPWRGQGRGSPARGGGEGESGQGSVAGILCPPAHLWDRGSGAGAKGRSGWAAGSEAARRRRALTSDVDRQHGALPGVTRETEARK